MIIEEKIYRCDLCGAVFTKKIEVCTSCNGFGKTDWKLNVAKAFKCSSIEITKNLDI